jgi:sulfatase maturation enzyme AslB (radical SAM superfamily)
VPSLQSRLSPLADSSEQLKLLNNGAEALRTLPKFHDLLAKLHLTPFRPLPLEIFQVNIGKMCNQVCKHCHVDAGPDRKEIMSRVTMEACLRALEKSGASTVDLTGGAPEMNPHFRWYCWSYAAGYGWYVLKNDFYKKPLSTYV